MVRDITLVLAAIGAAMLVLFLVQGLKVRQEISGSKVHAATRSVQDKFLELSTPIIRDLSILAKWGQSGILEVGDTRLLNGKFIPMLESQTMVSSLIIADTDGREYFLLREKQSWLTRSANAYRPGMKVALNRWSTAGDLLETWAEKRTFDPRSRNWFAGALQLPGSGTSCEKVIDPVFLTVGKNEDFYIRSGPSSIRLSMSKMVKYLEQRK